MDTVKAKAVLVDMRHKYRMMRDTSRNFGEKTIAREYSRQVDALDTAIAALEALCRPKNS